MNPVRMVTPPFGSGRALLPGRSTPALAAIAMAVLALAVIASPAASAAEAESASYLLGQDTVDSGGQGAESGSFLLAASAGQESVVGLAASSSFQLESGFWTSATITREVAFDAAGSGSGQIIGAGIACQANAGSVGGDCAQRAPHGSPVSAVATPDTHDFFTGWSGCDELSTTNSNHDTCALFATRDVAATAEFVAGGGIEGIVWLDYDGDGLVGAGEPGIADVTLLLDDGDNAITLTTDAAGAYARPGLFPGSYSIAVDETGIPVGSVPTHDPDGVQSPLLALVDIEAGMLQQDLRFGFQPLADLAVEIDAVALPEGEFLFTITVVNLGLADASEVQVAGTLSPTQPLETSGCQEDPSALPICTLGDLAAGDSAAVTILTRSQAAQSAHLTAEVSVSALETDPVASNNQASVQGLAAIPVPTLATWSAIVLAMLLLGVAVLGRRNALSRSGVTS